MTCFLIFAQAERRQIFRDEVEHIKAPLHPIEHNQNDQHYDSKPVYDDYYQGDYRPSYQVLTKAKVCRVTVSDFRFCAFRVQRTTIDRPIRSTTTT